MQAAGHFSLSISIFIYTMHACLELGPCRQTSLVSRGSRMPNLKHLSMVAKKNVRTHLSRYRELVIYLQTCLRRHHDIRIPQLPKMSMSFTHSQNIKSGLS
ncbi:hypothetical protein P692DRAFT_2051604 [Suillus brevipes Sb2]|nr:hypothetical protein P692DRAFT_2051604 [Suillus brevipes Sb2]